MYIQSLEAPTLKSIPMHPKDKISLHLKQNIVYKWSCPEESCSQFYIGESSRCLENKSERHSSHVTHTIYIRGESDHHPHANISHFKVINQDSKQVAREAREAIHIMINNPALNHNRVKMFIPEIFNSLLGADRPSNGSLQVADPNFPLCHSHLIIASNRFSRAVCKLTQLGTFLSPIGKCQVLLNFCSNSIRC